MVYLLHRKIHDNGELRTFVVSSQVEHFSSPLSVKSPDLPGRGQNKPLLRLFFYYLEKAARES